MGKRRQQGHQSGVAQTEPEIPAFLARRPWLAVLIAVGFLALIGGAGWGITVAVAPHPTGPLAKCRTAPEVAPHTYSSPPAMCIDVTKKYTATIETSKGRIGIQLVPQPAPVSVNNFIVLAVNGYYDGLAFWRIEDWVVQSGDPTGRGRGGPGYNLPDEGSGEAWVPGSVGMARTPGGPTNGSQFFITKAAWPAPGPDVPYNRIGIVLTGLDVVGQLARDDRIISITIKVA